MKNVFAKFLLLAAVVGVVAGCDKDEKNDPANYLEIGGKKTEIGFGVLTQGGQGGHHDGLVIMLFGKGVTMVDGLPVGKANTAMIGVPDAPGEYMTDGLEVSICNGGYITDFNPTAGSDEDGFTSMGSLVKDSKIVWSKNGNIYTIDASGNTVDMDGAAAQPFKVHFSGELMEIQPE